MTSARASQRTFFGISALLFAASAAATIAWCASMSSMGDMPMPGGWTISMAWMRMPGETWTGAAASFLLMWVVMMLAMMLPSLIPMLWRYRQALLKAGEAPARTNKTRLGRLTTLVGVGYFLVWTAFGMIVFPLGVAAWKARHLASCRTMPEANRILSADAGTAWRYGLRLGLHCSYGCAGLTAILLVIGVMDLRAMAVVTAAITVERLAPAGEHAARAIGGVVIAAALFWIARTAGLA